jgi:hypothetical protein
MFHWDAPMVVGEHAVFTAQLTGVDDCTRPRLLEWFLHKKMEK